MSDTLDGLAASAAFPAAGVADLRTRFLAAYSGVASLLERREAQGKVRRCHGDLHLRNIVLEADTPVLFDAIEFDDGLATIDILYDLAFVLMDFWQRGLRDHANLLFNRYLWRTPEVEQELEGLAALPLFLALRAAIRALVTAALSNLDAGDHSAEARQFFGATEDFCAHAEPGLSRSAASRAPAKAHWRRRWRAASAMRLAPCIYAATSSASASSAWTNSCRCRRKATGRR